MNPRLAALLALLVATVLAGRYLGQEEASEPVVRVHAHRPTRPVARAPVAATPVATTPTRFPGGGADLFPVVSWRPPPPPPPKLAPPPPPPPPQAPPLPFKYLGRWRDDQGETVFLAQGERVVNARAGQILQQWRLDRVSADGLTFTYLPLNQQRPLRWTP